MKCFVAVLLLALFAMIMAVEQAPEVSKVATEKGTQADTARDKRGLLLDSTYAPLSYAAPYAYPYSYNLPYAYSSYAYPSYYRYPYYSSSYVL